MTEDIPTNRPLVTFALFAYNQEQYICEAVEGAFSQTYEPLEIILSDDCSPDRTFEVMQKMAAAYEGPHRVHVRRSELNRGLAEHINEVVAEVGGDVVVVAAGDDISLPERTERLVKLIMEQPDTFAAFSNYNTIPNGGNDAAYGIRNRNITLAEITVNGGGVQIGATYAYRREVFLLFGSLPKWVESEDRVLPFRAALLGKVRYVSDALVRYRLPAKPMDRERKSKRVHGYNQERHLPYLLESARLARAENKIPWQKTFVAAFLIQGLHFALHVKNPVLRWFCFVPLRMVRKVSVTVTSGNHFYQRIKK